LAVANDAGRFKKTGVTDKRASLSLSFRVCQGNYTALSERGDALVHPDVFPVGWSHLIAGPALHHFANDHILLSCAARNYGG
jgi:hypothetical protein